MPSTYARPPSLIRWLSVRTQPMRQILRLFAVVVRVHKTVLESCDSIGHDGSQPPHVRPEALGSPAGYAVLPGHRLLWPHPSLWLGNRAISAFPTSGARGSGPGRPARGSPIYSVRLYVRATSPTPAVS